MNTPRTISTFSPAGLAAHDAHVRETARLEFAAELRAAVGPAVKHSGGSAGVFELSPKGDETEFWGYENATAYTSAVLEVLAMLNPEHDYNEMATTFAGGRATPRSFEEALAEFRAKSAE